MLSRSQRIGMVTLFTLFVIYFDVWFGHHSVFLRPLFNVIDTSPSLASFGGDLMAGLYITILGAFFIPAYLTWRQRPKLVFRNRATRTDTCELTKRGDGISEGVFQLVVRNNGSVAQREWYWHILAPEDAFICRLRGNPAPPSEQMQGMGKTWIHYYGKIGEPVYANGGFIFPYEMEIVTRTANAGTHEIYYYFSTENGTSPARAKKFSEIVAAYGRDADNMFRPDYLSKLLAVAK